MIKCFIMLCQVANPNVCLPPVEIKPANGEIVTSPLQCGRGGLIVYTEARMNEPPDRPGEVGAREKLVDGAVPPPEQYIVKWGGRMEGDGSDIVRAWVAKERARLKAAEPQ